jgi:uncharacterized protein YjiS (DUF1127 family)
MPCPTIVMSGPLPQSDSVTPGRRHGQSFLARAARFISARWQAYWDHRARRATVLLLRSLDARTLHDIGIAPSEIESLVQGGGHSRRYDPAWPRWR